MESEKQPGATSQEPRADGSQLRWQRNRDGESPLHRGVNVSHPLLLQGAMELEVATLRKAMTEVIEQDIGSFRFWQGKLGKQPVVLSQTGIGTAAAAAATALGCEWFRPSLVLNQGTAGGYPEDLHPYDLVLGETWYNANAWFQASYGKKYFLDLAALEGESKESEFTGAKPFLHNSDRDLITWLDRESLHYTRGCSVLGCIASGDQWNDEPDAIANLQKQTGALCEEMETAAAGEAAARLGMPFVAVRVISNNNRMGEPFDPGTAVALQEWIIKAVTSL